MTYHENMLFRLFLQGLVAEAGKGSPKAAGGSGGLKDATLQRIPLRVGPDTRESYFPAAAPSVVQFCSNPKECCSHGTKHAPHRLEYE